MKPLTSDEIFTLRALSVLDDIILNIVDDNIDNCLNMLTNSIINELDINESDNWINTNVRLALDTVISLPSNISHGVFTIKEKKKFIRVKYENTNERSIIQFMTHKKSVISVYVNSTNTDINTQEPNTCAYAAVSC